MAFDLTAYLDPLHYMPVGWHGWTVQILPAAVGIWGARPGRRLSRGRYLRAISWRGALAFALWLLGQMYVITRILGHEPASATPAPDLDTSLAGVMGLAHIAAGFLLARPLVYRLRDGGIKKRWAFLALVPYLDLLMLAALLFIPRSRPDTTPPVTATADVF